MVQKQVKAFEDNPTIGAVFTLAKLINVRGEVIGEGELPVELSGKRVYYLPEIFLSILENRNFLMCPSCMVRSQLYKELAPFDVERFGSSADLDMWLRLLERCPIAILDERLMCYRLSKTQGSYQLSYLRTEQSDFFRMMDYYLSVKSGVLDIPHNALNKYEFRRSLDNIRCAANYLIKDQPREAKKLLRKSFSATILRGAVGSIGKPEPVAYWVFGILLLILIHLGLGRHLRKGLHWLLYERKRSFE
jgi:uncharacterized Zn-finger protein